ncbi:GMC oxidoreductase [Niabella drilacis]|uniref:Choline dehydrogenase n=1 Tax=Niabella drilacis (strain DSM 25811 / CCM 8410 / CCUG 62505 / LMG 26954 / E90) TaxID=1285928 RepID=A0A1G6WH03_NIADE|nr:GMC family oxidoreductase [Niabella drilacis]SDD65078.1 Choline dehydrogenase [Niabella drilacis]
MADNHYDAIVIGSGISGGWAAKELCEKGLKVLLLERGKDVKHITDYVNAGKGPWEFSHHGSMTLAQKRLYPNRIRGFGPNEINLDWWANDTETPYTEVKQFNWFRGYQVGGRSLLWGKQTYRWSDIDYEANAKDGIAIDWPVRYAEIAPWYDHVERFIGVSGSIENLPQLPDGQFLPPMEMNVVEKDMAARIKTAYRDQRRLIIGRCAHLTEALPGRSKCQYRNKCDRGCPYGGYFSTQSSTLPAAMKTGNLTLRPWSIVTKILYDKDKKRATGVEVLDAETNKTYEYKSKIVFLNASTLNSTWVLLHSATDIWPGGLGSSSGELGHNLMDHHLGSGAGGRAEGYDDMYTYGRRPNGVYIPRYRNLNGEKRDYIRGFGYQGGAGRGRGTRAAEEIAVGAALKEALTEAGTWSVWMGGFGEVLPYHDNLVTLDRNRKDKWGLDVLAIDAELKENEKKMRREIINDGKEMLEKAGIKDVYGFDNDGIMGQGIHEMGTARMGSDPKTSVLNKWNQVWDAPNVFVTDGSFMTSAGCVNPSLTYMAFTARAAAYAVSELKKQNL